MRRNSRIVTYLGKIAFVILFVGLGWHFAFSQASSPVYAAATEPYGVNAITSFDRLPYLKLDTAAGGQSSFDRADHNADYNNFLYTDTNGDKVLLDLKGPGTIYRLWFTGFDAANATIKVYFDGSAFPTINRPLSDLFSGNNPPFLAPLVGTDSASSGGFYCYVPFPFHSGIKITSNGAGSRFYYNIGYHLYSPDTNITTWTGSEDMTGALNLWNGATLGVNPTSNAGTTMTASTFNLGAGATQTMLDGNGPGEISSIRLHIPEVAAPPAAVNVTDDGRAFTGSSQFTMAIDPKNQGVFLKRRLDYGVADQQADISVDGALVGRWSTAGGDSTNHWRDSTFYLPAAFTAGKSSITVTVTFVSSQNDWNEFTYWALSIVGNGSVQTDLLDVGNTTSEAAHNYSIKNQTWNNTRSFTYPAPDGNTTDILNNIWMRIYWDHETTPSVNAPLGSLFGMGQFGSYHTQALAMGMDETNTLYLYFPMPFQFHTRIDLVSQRTSATNTISAEIRTRPFTDSFQNVGYFKTQFNSQQPTANGQDILILNASGAGQFLGVVQSMDGPTNRAYLEGNERIYVDGSNSPVFQGTGTEDFFNGGWYFNHGLFTRPLSGNTAHIAGSADDKTAAYRLFLQDVVPFRAGIHVSIEHGPTDFAGVNENVWTLAYYYAQPSPRATLTDTMDVDNASSENAHHYTITNQTWQGTRTYEFEGMANTVAVTDDGRAHKGTSQFTLALNSNNHGAILRHRFDQNIGNQQAQVLVDGNLVGTWYHAGNNPYLRWREDDFFIPASFTVGKGTITITIQFVSSDLDWNEFRYFLYSQM